MRYVYPGRFLNHSYITQSADSVAARREGDA